MRQTAFLLTRRSAQCCRGKYSSMMDMGGVAQPDVDTRINVGKNNKVQAVALDFHLITRSIEERRRIALEEKENSSGVGAPANNNGSVVKPKAPPIQPDISLIEKMANLLNVNLGGDSTKPREKDDLSAILGSSNAHDKQPAAKKKSTPKATSSSSPHMDIRSKYASKLRNKIDGGVAGLELAKFEKEDTLKRGDASLHMAARNLISTDGMGEANVSSPKWLATTGVGRLLSFLSGRSMQIALLPVPCTTKRPLTEEDVSRTSAEMERLTRQLSGVEFNLLIPDGRRRRGGGRTTTTTTTGYGSKHDDESAAGDILETVLSRIDVPPLKFVAVSDRDDYLRAARDVGMFTCRVRPLNKRRGNVTTDYNVEDAGSVQDVINEINGISYNFALKS